MRPDPAPSQGEIWWVDFAAVEQAVGHEQAGDRPAVVMTHFAIARKLKMCVVIPCTTAPGRGRPNQLAVRPPMWVPVQDRQGASYGWALPAQVRAVSFVRLRRRAGSVPHALHLQLAESVLTLWGLCAGERQIESLDKPW